MTSSEKKARELVEKYHKLNWDTDTCFGDCEDATAKHICTNTGHGCGLWKVHAKAAAIICVDEIMEGIKSIIGSQLHMWTSNEKEIFNYWQSVKQAIQQL